MPCWNCGIPIEKAADWTPKNKHWIENPYGATKDHDFKKCYIQNPKVRVQRSIRFNDPILDSIDYTKELYHFLKHGYRCQTEEEKAWIAKCYNDR